MTSKISMLQRQQAFQARVISSEHHFVDVAKDQIKWLKGVPDISSTQKRIDVLYKCVEASKKRIAKLVEMQKFTKGQLQEAYSLEMMFNSSLTSETFLYWPEPLPPVGDHTSYMKPGGERLPRPSAEFCYSVELQEGSYRNSFDSEGNLHAIKQDAKAGEKNSWKWETPTMGVTFAGFGGTGLRHDLPHPSIIELFKREQYKHNPKFMGEAPAAEVGNVVGEEM